MHQVIKAPPNPSVTSIQICRRARQHSYANDGPIRPCAIPDKQTESASGQRIIFQRPSVATIAPYVLKFDPGERADTASFAGHNYGVDELAQMGRDIDVRRPANGFERLRKRLTA